MGNHFGVASIPADSIAIQMKVTYARSCRPRCLGCACCQGLVTCTDTSAANLILPRPADDLIAISGAHAMQPCCDDHPLVPSWTTIVVPTSRYCSIPCVPAICCFYYNQCFQGNIAFAPTGTPLSANQDEHHVDQPAALAAWLGLMLAQHWSSAALSAIANTVTPRLLSSRLRFNTPTQER